MKPDPTAPILDKLGQVIRKGSFVIASIKGEYLAVGKVLALKATISKFNSDQLEYRITVMSTDDRWGRPPALNSKAGTYQFPERLLVVYPAQVPSKYRELLDPVEEWES